MSLTVHVPKFLIMWDFHDTGKLSGSYRKFPKCIDTEK